MGTAGKIAFIVRKKHPDYTICIEALRALNVPTGFDTELVIIKVSKSIAADRQQGMLCCHADYKIYLEDNAIILDENFICKMIEIFNTNKEIGLLGAIGTNIVPTSGIAISSSRLIGEIFDDQGHKVAGNKFTSLKQNVKAIIGALMATQYDLDWPTDYNSEFFYDTAYSLEYQRNGYKCAVLNMSTPLIWKGYDTPQPLPKEQNLFLDKYSIDLYPIVSVIIPSYQRPKFLEEAINSVLGQTYRNLDILISDRSHDMLTEHMVKEKFSHDPRLHYVHHNNFNRLQAYKYNNSYNNPNAEYVNWLMDDDLFAPKKIARMIDVYNDNPDVTLVTSYRKCINSNGNIIPDRYYTKPLAREDFKISGPALGKKMLLTQANIIGELSACLIKKKNLYNGHLGCFEYSDDNVLSDFTTWIHMCSCGNIIYLTETLSYVRIHDGQDQLNPLTRLKCIIMLALLLDYDWHNTNFLESNHAKKEAMKNWSLSALTIDSEYDTYKDHPDYKKFKQIQSVISQAMIENTELNLESYY